MALKDIIKRKQNEARLNIGRATTPIDLKNGLRIRLEKKPGKFKVYLSRQGKTAPSLTEIQTFIDHWPALSGVEAEDFTTVVVFYIIEK